jgi:hypothetical protein
MFWSHWRTPLFSTAALQRPEVFMCNRGSRKARRLNTFAYDSVSEGPSLTGSAANIPARKPGSPGVAEEEHELQKALRDHPDSFEANHQLGEFYLSVDDLKIGIPYLENAQRLMPEVIAVDTSGSIGKRELEQFAAEISAISEETQPEAIHVAYCDAAVQSIQQFGPAEPVPFEPKGGGGTDFRPAFEWVAENDFAPICLIYLTDLCCDSFPETPEYPVLWVTDSREWRHSVKRCGSALNEGLPAFFECEIR